MAESREELNKGLSRRPRKQKICQVCGGDFSHSAYYSHRCTAAHISLAEDEEFVPPVASGSSSSSDFEVSGAIDLASDEDRREADSLYGDVNMDSESDAASFDMHEPGIANPRGLQSNFNLVPCT